MTRLQLTRWSIRRSGANLTITGLDADTRKRKVTGIQQIYPSDDHHALPYGAGFDEQRASVRVELA